VQLTRLKGIGEALAGKFASLGIDRVQDLLFHLPIRYEDRTRIQPMNQLAFDQPVLVQGQVVRSYTTTTRRPMLVCEISDGSGTIALKFFHFFRSQQVRMRPGATLRVYGEARYSLPLPEMIHPEYQHIGTRPPPLAESLTPVYPKTEGLSQKAVQTAVAQAMQLLEQGALPLTDYLAESGLLPADMPALHPALQLIHRPPPDVDVAALLAATHPAQQRLVLEEITAHFLAMQKLRQRLQSQPAPRLRLPTTDWQAFQARLPFALTAAQQRVISEILDDLVKGYPMQRLVQGDVGSGKTVVAAAAMLAAAASSRQAALMAPTELLAEQHAATLANWFGKDKLVFLSASLNAPQRRQALQRIASGVPLVVGTHSLFQDEVAFADLGLVIVDEQHRFGVHQRLALRSKGQQGDQVPHQLIMTATPIPRTLAQTAYANLDVSVIDELPAGRQPVTTVVLSNEKMPQVAERIRAACARGEQAYWVCTLIDESEMLRARAASDTAAQLAEQFPDLRVGLVHGRMKSDEKNAVMQSFKAGEIDLLVATTVIEVGVDVPNASLMVIENAERLGLSQLHQLRGRVGRGNRHSHCVLMYQPPLGETARQRLDTLRRSHDGFEIARVDLQLRGPGEVLGTRQKGALQFRLADLERDAARFEQARKLAPKLLRQHPQLADRLIQRWLPRSIELARI
jgi:ATP-dependent DNA helicase RecG